MLRGIAASWEATRRARIGVSSRCSASCATEIQAGVADRKADHVPDQSIAFRIGINLGDVIVDAGDVYGDGVNVAARLEGLADPGGIVVSHSVRDHVQDRLPLRFEDMGEQLLKNIARPVRAFRIRTEDSATQRNRKIGPRGILSGATAIVAVFGVAIGIVGALEGLDYHLGSLAPLTTALLKGSSVSQIASAQLAPPLSIHG